MDDALPDVAAWECQRVMTPGQRLEAAVSALERMSPELSARHGLTRGQIKCLGLITALTIALLLSDVGSAVGAAVLAVIFAALLWIKLLALVHMLTHKRPLEALTTSAIPEPELPEYTILVALHDEANVAEQLVAALNRLDYPTGSLDIIFALEAHDHATCKALEQQFLPGHMRIVIVPRGLPQTKPRALCYALTFARGDYVVVFDAEDDPDPQQLRAALAAFRAGGPALGCVQARLSIAGAPTLLSAQFAIEYAALFDAIVPALSHHGLPVLLGGTSNHFPRHVLDSVGGWDPYNVTEDADLGVRLARAGWRVSVLNSDTVEDAPDGRCSWLAQRTRWQKGWLQTYIVHMRHPVHLWRDLGGKRWLGIQLVLGGGLLCALIHPWLYLWFFWHLAWGTLKPPTEGPALWLWWLAVTNLIAAYALTIAVAVAALWRRKRWHLMPHALLAPLYWLPVSLALYLAFREWFVAPHAWAKTPHRPRAIAPLIP